MEQILKLKERINQNHRKIQRKYPMTKIILSEINKLIDANAAVEVINKWIQAHESTIFGLTYHLEQIEKETFTR